MTTPSWTAAKVVWGDEGRGERTHIVTFSLASHLARPVSSSPHALLFSLVIICKQNASASSPSKKKPRGFFEDKYFLFIQLLWYH